MSVSIEPFTMMHHSLPSSQGCTLAGLLMNLYEVTVLTTSVCSASQGECTHKSEIRKLPPVLIQYIKQFDNSARTTKNLC